jgi:hypothetical protein
MIEDVRASTGFAAKTIFRGLGAGTATDNSTIKIRLTQLYDLND